MEKHYLIVDKLAACCGMWSDLIWCSMRCLIPELSQRQSYRVKPAPCPKQTDYSCGKQRKALHSPQDLSLLIHLHMSRVSGLSRSIAALSGDLSFASSSGSRADNTSLGLLSTTMHCAAYKCCKSLGCFGWVRVFSPTIFLKPTSWPLEAIKHSITSQINCNSVFKC